MINWVTGRWTLVLLGSWIGYAVLLFNFGPYGKVGVQAGRKLLEETPNFTVQDVNAVLSALGEAGRQQYLAFQMMDYLHGVLMGLALAALLVYCIKSSLSDKHPLMWLAALPMIGLVAEVLESTFIITFCMTYPDIPNALVPGAALVTNAKLYLAFGTLPIALLAVLMWAVVTMYRKTQNRPQG